MAPPTRNDVARFARVSGATVSRVLSGRMDLAVTQDMRERVLAAAEALGYRPNPTARALVTGRTQIIGLWMCLDYSRYRSQVVGRMQRLLRQSDYCLTISDIEEEIGRRHSFTRASRVPADGVIAFDTPTAGSVFARANRSPHPCFVSMGAYWDEHTHFVGVDLYAGAVEAVRHLVSTGRRNIAFLYFAAEDIGPARARYDAYRHVLREAGLEARYIPVPALCTDATCESVRDYLRHVPGTDAIFCLSDDMALGAYRAITDLGRHVGEDVALVGCDGIEETELLPCPITTIRQPAEEMCAFAWQFLQTCMEDPTGPLQQRILTPQLVIRASSRR